MVTVPIDSLFCRPLEVKADEPAPPVSVCPYVLLALFAVTVNEAVPTIIFPVA